VIGITFTPPIYLFVRVKASQTFTLLRASFEAFWTIIKGKTMLLRFEPMCSCGLQVTVLLEV
jgi:hypothetical protein